MHKIAILLRFIDIINKSGHLLKTFGCKLKIIIYEMRIVTNITLI